MLKNMLFSNKYLLTKQYSIPENKKPAAFATGFLIKLSSLLL